MNGITHSDSQMRQRHKGTASHDNTSPKNVAQRGNICIVPFIYSAEKLTLSGKESIYMYSRKI